MTDKQKEEIRGRLREESQVLHKIYSNMKAVNKKDECEIGAEERKPLVYCLV